MNARAIEFIKTTMWPTYILMIVVSLGLASTEAASSVPRFGRLATSSSGDDKEQEMVDKAAGKLYEQAHDRFDDRDYWQATADLIVILDYYPGYTEIDDVVYLLGTCLYEMEMYEGADRLYRHLLNSVGKTEWLAEALLGLQRSAYQKRDFEQSLKFYKALEAHYTQDDNIYESRYYASQTYYRLENFDLVLNIVPYIKKKSDFYAFALYTQGLAQLKKKASARLSKAWLPSRRPRVTMPSAAISSTLRA